MSKKGEVEECPFCKILENDELKQVIKRGDNFTAIRKLYNSRNLNFLVISNTHVENLKTHDKDVINMNELITFVNEMADGKDWSIKVSNGKQAGQDIFHFHAHINSYQDPRTWGL